MNKAKDRGILKLPIPLRSTDDFPILQYADDTLVIMEGCSKQLLFLKRLLNSFSECTRLRQIHDGAYQYLEERLDLARTFACDKGSFLFTYLGLPLELTKPKVGEFLPLVTKSLPTFHLCTFNMYGTVLEHIDKLRKHCLWRGSDINAKQPPKEAWTLVAKPKKRGD
ncbi:hypothetical protein U9M48_025009 [Paspalum notatum var. saurae]|uniref:Reverse transcriptase domain-containing protein n=1 Tax=Paspalum notatum var. saurae TaxID=547442 RepID=A0AAQ3TNG2_PASNO